MVVLIAEDTPIVAFMIEEVLRDEGHEILGPVDSAERAIDLLDKLPIPTLALVDINLSGQANGVDVARIARERHVNVVFVTGQVSLARTGRDFALGVLEKPFTPNELAQTVNFVAALLRGESVTAPPRFENFRTRR